MLVGTSSSGVVGAQNDVTTTSSRANRSTTTTKAGPTTAPGRIAYVSPTGEVVVAESDGSAAKVVGAGAVRNGVGLAPLAWSPDGTRLAYVRNDRSLVLASTDGTLEPLIVANDAVVPANVSENILSFIVTGSAIAYLAQLPGGQTQAGVKVFDGPEAGEYKPLSDPATRTPLGFQFSPLDPYLYLRSADVETGREFTIAVVEPFGGAPFATPFSVDDPVFAPDGAYLYGVIRGQGLEQLVRVDTITAQFTQLLAQDRICKPMPSPDGTRIVYAAGPTCGEIWTIDSTGAEPQQVVESVNASATFSEGVFSWSLDGSIVSHAACAAPNGPVTCGGPYWDIRVDGSGVKARAQAGSVLREFRPLVKSVKAEIDISGPIEYQGKMLISASDSAGKLLNLPNNTVVEAKGVDQNNPEVSFSIKVMLAAESRFLTGTLHIVDPTQDFDQTFTLIGSATLQSYRYASLRGIWFTTSEMPFQSGRIELTLFR